MEKTSQDLTTTKIESTKAMNFGHEPGDHASDDSASEMDSDLASELGFGLPNHNIEEKRAEPQLNDAEAAATTDDEELRMVEAPDVQPVIEPGAELIATLEAIPDKMAFKIGEAADMVGVKQYVLRYWETEFEVLKPRKSKNNQRVYSRRDVETAMMIKKLLYDDRFSIEGARTALRQLKTHVKEERGLKQMAHSQDVAVTKLKGLVSEIRRIKLMFA